MSTELTQTDIEHYRRMEEATAGQDRCADCGGFFGWESFTTTDYTEAEARYAKLCRRCMEKRRERKGRRAIIEHREGVVDGLRVTMALEFFQPDAEGD